MPYLLLMLCALLFSSKAAIGQEAKPDISAYQELVVQVRINGTDLPDAAVVLFGLTNDLYVQEQELSVWRIDSNGLPTIEYNDSIYYKVPIAEGTSYVLDEKNLFLQFNAAAERFIARSMSYQSASNQGILTSGAGAFFNYDLSNTALDGENFASAFLEPAVFTPFGVGSSNFFVSRSPSQSGAIRLNSTWEMDFPNTVASLRLGDSISKAAPWSISNRVGGIQFATNFRTQPYLTSSPLRAATGIATAPSTVEVFVNNVLQSRRQVAPGPFNIDNIPSSTGVGDVRVVIRDATGREQVLTQSFYQSPGLLRNGQHDFSYELGQIRRNFGRQSNDYGDSLLSATHRYGFTDEFTAGFHAESSENTQLAGGGVVVALGGFGAVNFDLAASQSDEGSGGLTVIGFERQARTSAVGLQYQQSTDGFRVLSEFGPQRTTSNALNSRFSYGFGEYGAVSITYSSSEFVGVPTKTFSTAYFLQLFGKLSVSLSYTQSLLADGQSSFFLNAFLPLDQTRSASFQLNRSGKDDLFASAQFRKSLPVGLGTGYGFEAGLNNTYRAEVARNFAYSTVTASASAQQGLSSQSVGAAGSAVFMDGGIYLSRRLNDSFGVVRVNGFEGVTVFAENQPVGRTNSYGALVVPNLRSYEDNRISIEQADLPFEVEISATELVGVPYYRSGVVLDFPVRVVRSVTFVLKEPQGNDVPSGSLIFKRDGTRMNLVVGTEGLVYLADAPDAAAYIARWKGGECHFEFDLKKSVRESSSPIDLGTLKCLNVH
jgi:outer membrane usher protein